MLPASAYLEQQPYARLSSQTSPLLLRSGRSFRLFTLIAALWLLAAMPTGLTAQPQLVPDMNELTRHLARAETQFDRIKHRFAERLGRIGPVQIQPYIGHGTAETLYLRGRVLEDKQLEPSEDDDSIWENILAAYKRFESDEIPGVRVRLRYQDVTEVVETDEEGYYQLALDLPSPLPGRRLWHDVDVTLIDRVNDQSDPARAVQRAMVPLHSSAFGVISDIDDTILQTNATSLVQMARLTFTHNARTRLPFKGVAAFYRALQTGDTDDVHNPIFYVSSSPWNLYDLLVDFMDLQDIPIGPLFLRDLGITEEAFIKSSHSDHKRAQIDHILETHPHLNFILIGDSGQHDPEIYESVVDDYPDRVLAIYIRDVSLDERDRVVDDAADRLRERVPLVRVTDTFDAARHAAEHGYISPRELDDILAGVKHDTEPADASGD